MVYLRGKDLFSSEIPELCKIYKFPERFLSKEQHATHSLVQCCLVTPAVSIPISEKMLDENEEDDSFKMEHKKVKSIQTENDFLIDTIQGMQRRCASYRQRDSSEPTDCILRKILHPFLRLYQFTCPNCNHYSPTQLYGWADFSNAQEPLFFQFHTFDSLSPRLIDLWMHKIDPNGPFILELNRLLQCPHQSQKYLQDDWIELFLEQDRPWNWHVTINQDSSLKMPLLVAQLIPYVRKALSYMDMDGFSKKKSINVCVEGDGFDSLHVEVCIKQLVWNSLLHDEQQSIELNEQLISMIQAGHGEALCNAKQFLGFCLF